MVPIPALTDKDRDDLSSRSSSAPTGSRCRSSSGPRTSPRRATLIGERAALLAKIEKPAAIDRLNDIVALADAVMVARGDLGVELPPEQVPPLQNKIVATARQYGKPVVVATQMLESMITSPTPTRAEVSDVATAIYDGADAVMLSAESAAGQYPCEAVQMMDRIATSVERDPSYPGADPFHPDAARADHRRRARRLGAADRQHHLGDGDGLLHQLGLDRAADRARAAAGAAAGDERVAAHRAPAWACCGACTRSTRATSSSFEEMVEKAKRMALRHQIAKGGDRVDLMAGIPFGTAGSTNVLHVVRLIGDELERHQASKAQRGSSAGISSAISRARKPIGPTFLASARAGLAVQPDRPQQGGERFGAARQQAADDAGEHVAAAGHAEARRAAVISPGVAVGVTTWLVTPLTSTIER